MATIQDMAKTATLIREGFLALVTEVGSNSHPMKIMDASVNLYLNICRLEEDLREADTSPSEITLGGAADKMPGGGLGNFDREGGLEKSAPLPTPYPHVEEVSLTGKVSDVSDYRIEYDDHQFFAAVTVPVRVLFSSIRDAVYRDPIESMGIVASLNSQGAPSCGRMYFGADRQRNIADDILEQAEKIEDFPEFKHAYGLWQQRAEAYNRAEEAYTKAA